MGKVWLDETEIGTFEPQTEGTSGNVLVNATNVGTFTLGGDGYANLNSTQVGTYVASDYVGLPVVALAFGSVTPPQGDVRELKVHLGCTKEVSSFECLLQNFDKKYSPSGTYPINVGDDCHFDIGRGVNCPLILTGRVEEIEPQSTPIENYIRVRGRCCGEKIFRRVVTKIYENQKGEAIVKDLLDNYVGLSHTRNDTELVENTDTTYTLLEYENTPVFDILKYIATTADKAGVIGFDFRVEPDGKFAFFPKNTKTSLVNLSERIEVSSYRKDIHRIRNKITVYGAAEKANDASKDFGTDIATPYKGSKVDQSSASGQKNLYVASTTDFAAGDKIWIYVYPDYEENEVESIVAGDHLVCKNNLQHTYGVNTGVIVYPGWGPTSAGTTITADAVNKEVGSQSVKIVVNDGGGWGGALYHWDSPIDMNKYVTHNIFARSSVTVSGIISVRDSNFKQASTSISSVSNDEKFHFISVRGGRKNADRWGAESGFDWSKIIEVEIRMNASVVDYWIDGQFFGDKRWEATQGDPSSQSDLASDAASGQKDVVVVDASIFSVGDFVWIQDDNASEYNDVSAVNTVTNTLTMVNNLGNTYTVAANGKVWIDPRELTETDEELHSDHECELRAKALLAQLKDPAEYLTLRSTIIDYYVNQLLPADKIPVTLPNENIDSDYRIINGEYHVIARDQTLEITLELGKEKPLLADYLYGLRSGAVTLERLARTKAGVR